MLTCIPEIDSLRFNLGTKAVLAEQWKRLYDTVFEQLFYQHYNLLVRNDNHTRCVCVLAHEIIFLLNCIASATRKKT